MNKRWISLMCVGAMLALAGRVRGDDAAGPKQQPSTVTDQKTKGLQYEAKLRAVILPQISLQDMPLSEVLVYLQKAAADSEQKFQLNIVNNVPAKGQPTITLTLRNISLYDALRYVTTLADLRLQIESNAVLIRSR